MLDVCLLGTGGMRPLPGRWLTACIMRSAGTTILIDCGEGTQITLRQQGWSFKGIDALLITHYHGDHVSGLPGLMLTIGNAGRTEPLHMYGPKGLTRIVKGLLQIAPELPFDIVFHELGNGEEPFNVGCFQITPFKLDHGIPCLGYRVDLLRLAEFLPEKARENNVPLKLWSRLQKGETVEQDGSVYMPELVRGEARRGLSVCYCTDTRPVPGIVEAAKEVDWFICEGMYGEEEKKSRANDYKHMTFREAAELAKAANVKELWLTHFTPSMMHPKDTLPEAREVFANSYAGKDRMTKVLNYDEE